MLYRRFGKTELSMPVLSCGGMRYQHSWQDVPDNEIPEKNQQNIEATIHRSLELGINHIETARGYGSSEFQLGKILPALPRESLIVQTKVSPHKDPKQFLATFEQSMANLQLDYVDLFAFHGINNEEVLADTMACLDTVRQLQQDGRIRHVGFSTHAHIDTICKAIDTGEFDYVNLHWYWIFQNNWPAILKARQQDMGMFIISPSDKGGMLYKPTPIFCECTDPLTPMAFNDLFCLDREEVHTLSIGASCPEDFDAHVKALDSWNNRKQLLPQIESRLLRQMESKTGTGWWNRFSAGLPEWWVAPKQINLKVILMLWSLDQAYGMREFAKFRYGLLGNGGHWFPGEKAADLENIDWAELLCDSPFLQEIPARLQQAHEWFGATDTKRLSESD